MKPRNSKKLVDAKEIHCSAFRLDLVLVFITTTTKNLNRMHTV